MTRLEPSSQFDLTFLAHVFSRGYEDYVVPFHMDEATLADVVRRWDIDLERSRVAFDGDVPVGLANLAVRGKRGWIGGIGVVPEQRQRGIGRALLEAVLAEAPGDVTLEVIEQNEAARRLYEQVGFVARERMLEVWSLTTEVAPTEGREVEPRPLGQDGLPWQREDASLPDDLERIEVEGGAAVFRVLDGTVGIGQLRAHDEEAARALLCALRARGDRVVYVNVPEGDPASGALRSLGASLDLRQYEMTWIKPSSIAPTG